MVDYMQVTSACVQRVSHVHVVSRGMPMMPSNAVVAAYHVRELRSCVSLMCVRVVVRNRRLVHGGCINYVRGVHVSNWHIPHVYMRNLSIS